MEYKLIAENWKKFINEQQPVPAPAVNPNAPTSQVPAIQLRTFGDVQKAIKTIDKQRQAKAIAGVGAAKAGEFALDQIFGLFPGATNAKSLIKNGFELFKAVYDANDKIKSNTWLDKINVDDQYSKIVDDTVENAFLKTLYNMVMQQPPDKVLPANYSVNAELEKYLETNFSNRSVSGRTTV